MSHKSVIILGAMIATLVAINISATESAYQDYAAENKSHHLIVGYRMPGDRMVLKQGVNKNSGWMKVQVIEMTFNVTKNERITMVQALDQKTNGKGAYASILKGGPGHNNVTMKFKSQRGHSINFVVELYARP